MDGIHDIGGMDGFGRMVRDDLVFHALCKRRAFWLALSAAIDDNTDDFRHAIERLDPAFYLGADYYGRWLGALEVRLSERGLIESDEVDRRAGGSAARPRAVDSPSLPTSSSDGGPRREVEDRALYSVGQTVRARDLHPVGHTRLPLYVRGRRGRVALVHPAFVFPDTYAHGWGDNPQYVYAVHFRATDLWGEGDHLVSVDLFEPYLEAA